nr:Rnase Y domain-containing protein [uncultured Schaedlerella sp.]
MSADEPETIEQLIKEYPQFKPMYQQIYEICRNTERVMGMYSEELRILDRNTVQLMIDEMQDEINGQKKALLQKDEQLSRQAQQLSQKDAQLSQWNEQLSQKDTQLSQKDAQLSQKDEQIEQQLQEIARLKRQLAEN